MKMQRKTQSFINAFLDAHLRLRPLESLWVGLAGYDHLVEDLSPSSIRRQSSFYRESLRSSQEIVRGAVAQAQRIDLRKIESMCRFNLHLLVSRPEHASDLEHVFQLDETLLFQEICARTRADWRTLAERLERLPAFVDQLGVNAASRDFARLPYDRSALSDLGRCLRAISLRLEGVGARALAKLGTRSEKKLTVRLGAAGAAAAESVERLRLIVEKVLLPAAGERYAIGAEEYRWRVQTALGIDAPLEKLAAAARESLERIHAEMRAVALKLDRGASLERLMRKLEADCPRDDKELFKLYRRLTDRCQRFVLRLGLFRRLPRYRLQVLPAPDSMGDAITTACYFPASPFNAARRGYFFVAPGRGDAGRLKAHGRYHAASTAVHEAFPGHDMQFFLWQNSRRKPPAVRFFQGDPRNYSTSLNIEGYAHYAEELMRRHGFFSPEEELFQWAAQAWRAARVVVDIGLHSGAMSRAEAARYFVKYAFAPPQVAKGEIFRYGKWPTQAITYFFGKRQIEALKSAFPRARDGALDEAEFHERLLGMGPVPPQWMKL